MMRMKAAFLHGVGDLRVEETDRPDFLAPDDVLIKIHACGVCPSDLRAYTGVRPAHQETPYTPGHEWSGQITAVGEQVAGFQVGDRVAPSWRVMCGHCHYCIRGYANFCENLLRGRVRGGFAQYGAAPLRSLQQIPDDVSYLQASFTEPVACCINGSRYAQIGLGDTVVVVGGGPIGLIHLQLAKHAGARVVVSDLVAERRQKALDLGADAVIDAGDDPVQAVLDLTHGYGADVIIVAVGSGKAQEQALAMAGRCARINYFAGAYPAPTIPLDSNLIHYKQIKLTGTHDYTPRDFEIAMSFIQMGIVQVTPLVSHYLPLEQVKVGFDTVANLAGLKVVVYMHGE